MENSAKRRKHATDSAGASSVGQCSGNRQTWCRCREKERTGKFITSEKDEEEEEEEESDDSIRTGC